MHKETLKKFSHVLMRARGLALYILVIVAIQYVFIAPLMKDLFAAANTAAPITFAWNSRADALMNRVEGVGAIVNDRLYVFGGFGDRELTISPFVDSYDPITDSWARIGEMPLPVSHITPAVDGDTVWIAGGFAGNHPGPAVAAVWKYHVSANMWESGPALPEVRAGGALVRYGRTLHYFGGFKADRETTVSDHWTLAIDGGGAWQLAAPMPAPRGHMSAIVLQDSIYSIGGQTGHDKDPVDQPNVYRYSPATDVWEERAALPAPRSHFEASTFVMHDRIVIVGGRTNTVWGQGQLATMLLYEPEADLWIALPSLPYTRIGAIAQLFDQQITMTTGGLQWNNPQRTTLSGTLDRTWEITHPSLPIALSSAAGAILGGKFYVFGSEVRSPVTYDLATDQWSVPGTVADIPLAGTRQGLVAFGERLYLFGGSGESSGQVQIYDPFTNQWSLGSPMPTAATEATAIVINDLIYVIWSSSTNALAPGMALYDPRTNSWRSVAAPPYSRRGAAMGSQDNLIYLLGGLEGGQSSDTMQVYNLATDSWATSFDTEAGISALPSARYDTRAAHIGDEIYLVGGTGSSIDVYRPSTNTWREETRLPTARTGPAVAVIADRIYVAGGAAFDLSTVTAFEVYNAVPFEVLDITTPTNVPSPSTQPTITPTDLTTTSTPLAEPGNSTYRVYLPIG